jgi:hypothetical protein
MGINPTISNSIYLKALSFSSHDDYIYVARPFISSSLTIQELNCDIMNIEQKKEACTHVYTRLSAHKKKWWYPCSEKKSAKRKKKNVAVYKAFKKCSIVRWEGVVGWRCRAMYTKHFFPTSLKCLPHSTLFIFHFEYNTSFLFSTSTFLFYFFFSYSHVTDIVEEKILTTSQARRRKLRAEKMSKWEKNAKREKKSYNQTCPTTPALLSSHSNYNIFLFTPKGKRIFFRLALLSSQLCWCSLTTFL